MFHLRLQTKKETDDDVNNTGGIKRPDDNMIQLCLGEREDHLKECSVNSDLLINFTGRHLCFLTQIGNDTFSFYHVNVGDFSKKQILATS